MKSIILCTLFFGLALSDKVSPTYSNSVVSASVSKVSPSNTAQSKSDTYGSPQSSPQTDSYGSPKAPAQAETYGSPHATPVHSAPATTGEVGTQGYYYYYYPVGTNGQGGSSNGGSSNSNSATSFSSDESSGLLGGLLAGKGVLVALLIGGLILLAIAGTTINFTGRSLTDLTDYAYNNFDDLTSLALQGIEFYEQINQ